DAKKHHANAAHYRHGNGLDQRTELGEKGKEHGKDGSPANHPNTVDLGESHDANILTVSRVGRTTKESSQTRRQAITGQRPVKTRVFVKVFTHYFTGDQGIT